jgi:hypothetical protein
MSVFLICSLLFFSAFGVTISDLCGDFQNPGDVCSPSQDCIGDSTTFIDTRSFVFFSNGSYILKRTFATGTCGSGPGTEIQSIATHGNISLNGNASAQGFTKISYSPNFFVIEIKKIQKALFYTSSDPGPCLPPNQYWENSTVGCPCNQTYPASPGEYPKVFVFSRKLIKMQCLSLSLFP